MAFNSAPHRKAKPTRLKNPLVIPTYQQQGTDCGLAKEKVPKMGSKRGTRNGALSKAQAPEPTSKDTIHDMTRINNHIDLAQASKNPIRAAGGGNAQVAPRYQSAGNVGSQPLNTVRSSVPRSSHPKPSPKETRDCKETKELVFKDPKEMRAPKEPKSFRHFKEPKDQKETKESKEPMESKDQKAKGADKSPNITHRTARHNTNRTKNYFDKYLKFAFDLSTPEGVQKLDAHFFPDPTASGSATVNREE
ncbi:chromodomain-helicase-DNA-binding protein 7 [Drosophila santomea]|uniref:chromodomain-helicase-DNA-binding protein 7 n=1 Tax=Drosophila santomea TaxID=129105 RepID=UPI0019536957|nr:chromodomain-helicase-DNA-binding protein 7 [Drosophila santomea]